MRELVSVGPGGSNVQGSTFVGGSEDGHRAFFITIDSLVPEDNDLCERQDYYGSNTYFEPCVDVYERDLDTGTTALVSIGPTGGTGSTDAVFKGASADGRHVFFETSERLVSEDSDDSVDVYERFDGTTRLVSAPTGAEIGGNGPYDASYDRNSRDGTRIFFSTKEPLAGGDLDFNCPISPASPPSPCPDVYERFDGTTRLLSVPNSGSSSASFGAGFRGASEDGTHVFFGTRESLVGQDLDSKFDVYERSGSNLTLISVGPSGSSVQDADMLDGGITPDGSHAFFTTREALVPEDTDSPCQFDCVDVYERDVGAGTTRLVSTGPKQSQPGGTPAEAQFRAVSRDGSHVFFETRDELVDGDADSDELKLEDVYERVGGTTRLVSTAVTSSDPSTAVFQGASDDGTIAYFGTSQRSAATDTDSSFDIFKRADDVTEQVTLGPSGGNAELSAFRSGTNLRGPLSADGRRFFFETSERLVPEDTNQSQDVYERFDGNTYLISAGGGEAFFGGSTADGKRFFFTSYSSLVPEDTDNAGDIYVAIVNDPPRCDEVAANVRFLWPANHKLRVVRLGGATDPEGGPVTLRITGVTQDEQVGDVPDARIRPVPNEAFLRAERDPGGDGRVYHVAFTAADEHGSSCSGDVRIEARRQQRKPAVDSAPPSYDSLAP